ncbi:MAG TPA: SDR family oxidoreductase [Bryobacteraceae bacterium]|nr:SDR family oxidoreductase [Bryobacteraceae bacterium]
MEPKPERAFAQPSPRKPGIGVPARAFVTGATGLLGSNLVQALLDAGYEVRGLVRSKEKAQKIFPGAAVDFVTGDMNNVAGFASHLAGCDVLFHTAAYFREYYQPGDHKATLEKINVQGTVDLLIAAEKQGVQKAIHISSAGVIGRKPDGSAGDESTPPDDHAAKNLYFTSKVDTELAIKRFLKERSLPVVMVLPSWMWGPGDSAPTAAGKLVLDFLKKKLPGVIDGGSSIVDVRDVAQATVAAADRGKSGERYIVGGHYFDFAEILAALERVTGVPAPTRKIPYALSLAVGAAAQTWASMTGGKALVTLAGVRTIHGKNEVNSAKAIRELGASFRPFEETVRDEVQWFRTHGYTA